MKKSSFRKNGDWHNDEDEHNGEDLPAPLALRVVLWLMFTSAFLMGGYGIYAWTTQELIPVAQRLAQPMPTKPQSLTAQIAVPAKSTNINNQPTSTDHGKKPSEEFARVPSPDALTPHANP